MDRSYYLENLGCAKNQVDAEIMISALRKAGWRRVEEPSDAAVIIVNSCGFIRPAKEESITTSLELHESFPGAKIVLSGCLSQRYGSEIVGQMPELSGVFGNRRPELIGELLERVLESPGELFLPALEPAGGTWSLPHRSELLSLPGSAYVKIAEGCNNRCSFCAIPLIRGNLRSRTMAEVVDEIRLLTGRGIREINLVAHDLNSY
ncbi:radical SAM protein, partial [Salinispira pacifica]